MSILSTTTAGRVVGGLFLSAFVLYGGGRYLLATTADGAAPFPENAASPGQLSAGASLMLLNSAAVCAIGVLSFRVLRRRYRRTAFTYLLTRVVEGALLAVPPAGVLTLVLVQPARSSTPREVGPWPVDVARAAVEHSEVTYWLAMAALGAGSMVFCWTLRRAGLLPPLLAAGGVVGYAVFAVGSVLQLSGYEVGLVLSAPGAVFEVAAGSYLVVKGFREITPRADASRPLGAGPAPALARSGAGA